MEDSCEAKWAREPGAVQAAEGLVLRGVQIYSKPDPRAAGQRIWWTAGVPVGCRAGKAGAQGVGGGALPEVGPWGMLSLAAEHTWMCGLERLWGLAGRGCQHVGSIRARGWELHMLFSVDCWVAVGAPGSVLGNSD